MNPWFSAPPSATGAPLLFVFPFAGGGAGAYRSWRQELGGTCDVWAAQLPGRETRIREVPRWDLDPLVAEIVGALPRLDRPFVFVGHSLGAAMALALALELRRLGHPLPARLILTGSPAPHLRDLTDPVHLLDDTALAERLRSYNGTPPELLESRELLALFLPVIRADFALVETWPVPEPAPLPIPFTVLGGIDDHTVTREQLDGWRAWTSAGCDLRWLPGDHFFIASSRAAVLDVVRDALRVLHPDRVVA